MQVLSKAIDSFAMCALLHYTQWTGDPTDVPLENEPSQATKLAASLHHRAGLNLGLELN